MKTEKEVFESMANSYRNYNKYYGNIWNYSRRHICNYLEDLYTSKEITEELFFSCNFILIENKPKDGEFGTSKTVSITGWWAMHKLKSEDTFNLKADFLESLIKQL